MAPTSSGGNTLYFAYDANLSQAHMGLWCPSAAAVSQAALPDYRLVFRTWADVIPSVGDTVQGCLYEVSPRDLVALDEFEDCPDLYRRIAVRVLAQGRPIDAMTYQMNPGHPLCLPNPDYLNLVLEGYKDWDLDMALLVVNA